MAVQKTKVALQIKKNNFKAGLADLKLKGDESEFTEQWAKGVEKDIQNLEKALKIQQATVTGLSKPRQGASRGNTDSRMTELQISKGEAQKQIEAANELVKAARTARNTAKLHLKEADPAMKDTMKAQLKAAEQKLLEADQHLANCRVAKGNVDTDILDIKTDAFAGSASSVSDRDAAASGLGAVASESGAAASELESVPPTADASKDDEDTDDDVDQAGKECQKFRKVVKRKRTEAVAQTNAPKNARKGMVEAQCDPRQARLG
jgi:hypothetical protein